MLTFVYGELFYSPARVLVNPVNTVGSMSSGLSYDFKRFYPEMYDDYRARCEADAFQPGNLHLYRTPHKWVLNFPVKRHYRAGADHDMIEQGLQKFAAIHAAQHITSVSFPVLADDLEWGDLRALMMAYLAPLPMSVYVHIHSDAQPDPYEKERRNIRQMRSWLTDLPQDVDFERFWRDVVKKTKDRPSLTTYVDEEAFKAVAEPRKKNKRISLKLTPEGEETLFIPETLLQDLWRYIRRAGYVLPQNMPGGLDSHGTCLVRLLAELDYLKPVQLAPGNAEPVVGLHYIPPVSRKSTVQVIDLAEPATE